MVILGGGNRLGRLKRGKGGGAKLGQGKEKSQNSCEKAGPQLSR